MGENKFIISISIDGGKKVHDLLRPFKNNEGSFDTIMNNIKLIREKYEELILVARMTIAQKDSPIYENIEQLISTNYFDYVSIYPASVKSNENEGGKYKYYFDEDVKGQFDYVISNYEELFKLSARFKGILEYEKIYDEILNGKLTINHCAAGGSYFTLSGDKSVVPCHRVCGQKEFMMYTESGDLDTKIINNWTHKVDQNPTCSTCWARYICGGGCKQENLSANGDINKINLASCEYHKFILERLIIGMNSFTESFNKRNICVDDLFVYCGRPATFNKRDDKVMTELGKVPGVNLF
ncbi:MAG: hypothetical protein BWY74_02543 [Firmicutes bacterium ADurb.Bin419]|nr:MAG: hypothetical protein BWY74_02543 [Firmicutes bacterium ADurb.Bin419]